MRKIAVLMGGLSSEREVSLLSGKNVASALAGTGRYDVVPIDLTAENLDALPRDVDAVYVALHGGWGENGGVQAALDALGIPYTGPGALASQIAMDKVKTKMVLELKGVPTPAWGLASRGDAACPMALPAVVKPPCDGSSVGISKVSDPADWSAALEKAFASAPAAEQVLVEEFIPGREYTVAVLDGEAWPAIEIVAPGGWYGYQEKYFSEETRYPFVEDAALSERLSKAAVDAYRAVGCRGVTRVDFRVSPIGRVYVLELNTSPGFTSHSLVPKAGMHTGLTLGEVCERILRSAACDR